MNPGFNDGAYRNKCVASTTISVKIRVLPTLAVHVSQAPFQTSREIKREVTERQRRLH